MDSTILDYFEKVFEGVNLDSTQKNFLTGIYLILFYKSCFELLLTIKGKDQSFLMSVNSFMDSAISSLDSEQKDLFEKSVLEAKKNILIEIINKFKKSLPERVKKKIEDNISVVSLLKK